MTALFSKPKIPTVTPASTPDPPPERTAAETGALADEQRNKFFQGQGGRALTMLTGGAGTTGGSSAVRFLGGAART